MIPFTQDVFNDLVANQGYIYLIQAVGTQRYKIGRSREPDQRYLDLKKRSKKNQAPYDLQLINYWWTPDQYSTEARLHKAFEQYRVYGEWFELGIYLKELSLEHRYAYDFEDLIFQIQMKIQEINSIVEEFTTRIFLDLYGAWENEPSNRYSHLYYDEVYRLIHNVFAEECNSLEDLGYVYNLFQQLSIAANGQYMKKKHLDKIFVFSLDFEQIDYEKDFLTICRSTIAGFCAGRQRNPFKTYTAVNLAIVTETESRAKLVKGGVRNG